MPKLPPLLTVALPCAILAACASPDPVAYRDLSSSSSLTPTSSNDLGGVVPYRYSTPANWRSYDTILLDPIAIYRGADNQFDDLEESDKRELADYMEREFMTVLSDRFAVVTAGMPGPRTLRLQLTLTGAETTTPVIAPLSHFDLSMGLYNAVQGARGGEGTFTGSVSYAVELRDGVSNDLLSAFVVKQYPNALNIPATFGSLSAAKVGIDKGAEDLLDYLSK